MPDLFSSFSSLGLGDLSGVDLYKEKESEVKRPKPAVVKEVIPLGEKDLLFDKSYTCPVCDNQFKNKTVRTGKNRLLRIERDLRQVYTPVDQVKYDVVACPRCGYAALGRYFDSPTRMQVEGVRKSICMNYVPQKWGEECYSYEDAYMRYQLALGNAIAKSSKSSEIAFICLKMAWTLRGKREALDKEAPDYEQARKEHEAAEMECLQKALDGFVLARQKEGYPMCGMDEPTTDYLLAALAYEVGDLSTASKMVSTVLTSRTASSHIKDKTRDLKEEIVEAVKKQAGKG
ncbi:MAG: DUF2225 domain-containing protein [Lachnospiraceae bacterium]|nr:DUF2225 domain-containing protein [Lachnospiraceae bacterium]